MKIPYLFIVLPVQTQGISTMPRFLSLLFPLLLYPFIATAGASPQTTQGNLAPVLKTILPSVVNIYVTGSINVPLDTVDQEGAPDESPQNNGHSSMDIGPQKFENLGSGVIVDSKKGYILTNAHVIAHAKNIRVTLTDGHRYKAKLIGTDPDSDVAVIQIDPENLTAIPLGNSDLLHVGDFVAAIGNPFGLGQTVTSGIISALQRNNLGIEGYENFIQTDASINPGNSGGALINMKGELIGINTAILGPEGSNIGIGFAIPSNMAHSVMEQLIQYGSVKRGTMGVLVQNLTPELASAFHVSNTQGAVITLVVTGSPADEAGIKPGDIIVEVNGKKIEDSGSVRNAIGLLRLGSQINLRLLRDGRLKSINLVTIDPNKYIEKIASRDPFLFGTEFRNFDEITPTQGHVQGVQIISTQEDTALWRAGLRRGDVLISVNGKTISNMTDLKKEVSTAKRQLLLNVLRQGGAIFVVVKQ